MINPITAPKALALVASPIHCAPDLLAIFGLHDALLAEGKAAGTEDGDVACRLTLPSSATRNAMPSADAVVWCSFS
jgi:hypothetical protein